METGKESKEKRVAWVETNSFKREIPTNKWVYL